MADPTYRIKGTILRTTDKAVQFLTSEINGCPLDADQTEWFPESQIRQKFYKKDGTGDDELVVTEWICRQKGLV